MIGPGSQQLRQFRRAIRDGATLEDACAATGGIISPAEGRIYIEADRKNPPPPEAFELLYDPDAKVAASNPEEETTMAHAAKKEDGEGAGITNEYQRPDAAKAFEIYDKQIKPKKGQLETIRGDLSQPYDDIKEHAHFPRKVLDFIIGLENLEESKRDHFLLALAGGLEHRKLFLPRDLVTMADGQDGGSVIPMGERQRPKLATLPMGVPSDGSETDLADAGEDDFEEASEEELATQEGRSKGKEKPASGTGAAAREAMREAAE